MIFSRSSCATTELLDMIIRWRNRIQTRGKLVLNSKMTNRFPQVVLYITKEFWGLVLLAMGHILIHQCDLKYSKQFSSNTPQF
jgi:hypothetical protein